MVPASIFTNLINLLGETLTVRVDSYYEDEASSWTGKGMWEDADSDYRVGAPEAAYVLTLPVEARPHVAAGMTLTVAGKPDTYTVVDVRDMLILTSEPKQIYVGVRL